MNDLDLCLEVVSRSCTVKQRCSQLHKSGRQNWWVLSFSLNDAVDHSPLCLTWTGLTRRQALLFAFVYLLGYSGVFTLLLIVVIFSFISISRYSTLGKLFTHITSPVFSAPRNFLSSSFRAFLLKKVWQCIEVVPWRQTTVQAWQPCPLWEPSPSHPH